MTTENAIALGTFDGVHLGHKAVLEIPDKYNKIAVTFYIPPKYYLGGNMELILSADEKTATLMKLGFNEICMNDFEKYKNMSATDFLEHLYNEYKPALISCGFNYRFGKGGKGDTELLKSFCENKNIIFKCADAVEVDGSTVSSTVIREYLKSGKINEANKLLYEPFFIDEEVIKGDKRGRTIGFPTINQAYPEDKVQIKFGVYKTCVTVGDKNYFGITYVGNRPSFKTDYVICETYIKDFEGELYGQQIKVSFLDYLRGEVKFSSVDELKEQLKKDIKSI